ncbi:MAG: GH92 family glycosyl hydrolase [Bacteroidales bacterium]|nr:GH92 family glycosyl hydrolase [Bacteroidales bacterium]
MRKLLIGMLLIVAITAGAANKSAVDYVNTLIGTALKGEGGTAPFVGRPFMMTNFLPQTRQNKMGTMAYVYDDKEIIGFMASHQPTVWMGDYGYVSLMPLGGSAAEDQAYWLPESRGLAYDHADETATPYYYSVKMRTPGGKQIKGEMTAASRAAVMRFTFPKKSRPQLVVQGINLNAALADWCNDYGPRLDKIRGYIEVDTVNNEVRGYNPDRQSSQIGPDLPNFKGYFVIKFNRPIRDAFVWDGDRAYSGELSREGTRLGATLTFDGKSAVVEARVGTSFISIEQARANLDREIGDQPMATVAAATRAAWEEKLAKIEPKGIDADTKSVFYTAMYHCYLFPREFSEYGRYYSAFDDQVHEGVSYNDYSLWDTFRAFHPLMTVIEPELTGDWITSLLQMYSQGGWMPMWPNPTYTNIMIGTHADALIADAYMKGIRNYDVDLAYEAMRKDAMTPPDSDTKRRYGDRDRWTSYEARAGASWYHSLGYIPDDRTAESVSRTLEYAYDDWCVAQVARQLGHREDYERLMAMSQNYRNIYNSEKGFMLPRKYNGEWIDLDDHNRTGLTEGSKWTYLFCVMQDVAGMIEMMGGEEAFAAKLDRNFAEGHYCHDNEPGHHYIYLYDYCGQPRKAQELVRRHTRINYHNAPDGVNGNDDCGQMSAWYIFSVMGFYPVTPGSNTFAIGAPQYPEITVKVGADGHSLTIRAENLSEENKYVDHIEIDGVRHAGNFLTWETLTTARDITFVMTR